MDSIEARLAELGLVLPPPTVPPPRGWCCRSRGCACRATGRSCPATARWPRTARWPGRSARWARRFTPEQGYEAARLTGLAMLSSLKAAPGHAGPGRGVAARVRHGQHGAGLRRVPGGHQRLHRPDRGAVRLGPRRACPVGDRRGRSAVRQSRSRSRQRCRSGRDGHARCMVADVRSLPCWTGSTTKACNSLPVIDMGGLGEPGAEAAIARQLDQAFSQIGFCYFSNIGVLARAGRRRVRAVAPLPRAAGRGQAGAEDERLPPRLHAAEDVADRHLDGGEGDAAQLQRIADDHARGRPRTIRATASRSRGRTSWPADLPGFQAPVQAYDAAMRAFCTKLLRPVALALGLAPDFMAPSFANPTTFPAPAALPAAGARCRPGLVRLRPATPITGSSQC